MKALRKKPHFRGKTLASLEAMRFSRGRTVRDEGNKMPRLDYSGSLNPGKKFGFYFKGNRKTLNDFKH